VTYGTARGVVIATGTATEFGKIYSAIQNADDVQSPLQQKLDRFGDLLTKIISVICIVVWLINIGHFREKGEGGWLKGAIYYFKIAVALAVAAIPEGLPAVVTTCLALGTRRMAAKNAIVRHLPSVETLGCTTVICSDKTGTLTTNQMSVQRVLTFDSSTTLIEYDVEGNTFAPEGKIFSFSNGRGAEVVSCTRALEEIGKIASLCNSSRIEKVKDAWQKQGESTEAALKTLVEKIGSITPAISGAKRTLTPASDYWADLHQISATLEFTRERKSMSVLCTSNGRMRLLVKVCLVS
jgi:P-type Ca2+ transporter type 2A